MGAEAMPDEERQEEFISCRARIARNCVQKVQLEMADEDSTFDAEAGTFICDPCWQRAYGFTGGVDDVDEAVRAVQDHDRNEEAASG